MRFSMKENKDDFLRINFTEDDIDTWVIKITSEETSAHITQFFPMVTFWKTLVQWHKPKGYWQWYNAQLYSDILSAHL